MFFDTFEQLCKQKGVSCKHAVMDMGLSHSIATKWKKTGATPEGGTLVKVAKYFNVPVESLLLAVEADELLDVSGVLSDKDKELITMASVKSISDEQLKFALWGDTSDITDADLEDVRRYAAFIRQRKEGK